jgi:hypothetical protein
MKYKDEGMNELHEELAKTMVISTDFKREIEFLAMQGIRQAYERGRADEQQCILDRLVSLSTTPTEET